MEKDPYQEYALIEKEIEILEERKKNVREEISKILPEEGLKNDFINAFWKITKKWKYSPKVDGLKAELDSTKELEEANGTATFEETKQLNIKVK